MKFAHMTIVSFLLFAAVLCFSRGARAEESYQTVLSGLYGRENGEQNSRSITTGLQGRFYFSPVRTDGNPYGEAAFLERIGSVYVLAEEDEFRNRGRNGDGPVFQAGINAAKPGVPYAVELLFVRSIRDYDAPSTQEVTGNAYGAKAGYFITATWAAGLSYLYNTWDNEWVGTSPVISRQQQYGLFTKCDRDLGQSRYISLQAALGRHTNSLLTGHERNTEASVQVDYYFTRSLNVGAGFANKTGTEEAWDGKYYSANVQYYFTPRLSAKARFERFLNANDGMENSRSFSTSVSIRF